VNPLSHPLKYRMGIVSSIQNQLSAGLNQLGFDFGTQQLAPSTDTASKEKQRWVQLGSNAVPYTLKRSARRTIGFSVGPNGLAVSAPKWSLIIDIEGALRSKQSWILTKLAQAQANRSKQVQSQQRWAHGESLPYLGKTVVLNVGSGTSLTRLQHGMFENETLLLTLNEDATEAQIKDAAQAWLQQEAKRVFAERIPVFELILGVTVKDWRLSNAQGRWGSATSTGNVRLHWRLIHFKQDVIDYVIAHELAHLREMNHSPRFWEVVESAIPDYKAAQNTLKAHALRGLV
jgi:predicted metal-dependent hydrolase